MSMNRNDGVAIGERIGNLAIELQGDIAGLDLSGDEVAFSALPYAPLFVRAKEAGLGITVHAGEWSGSDNIVESIRHLHADRIGHGVRAIENAEVINLLRDRGTALEICPTSNYQSGAVSSANQHPLAHLVKLGLVITINTDDPSVSNITLTDEYAAAVCDLGLSPPDLKRAIVNAARVAFIPAAEREVLASWFDQALTACDI